MTRNILEISTDVAKLDDLLARVDDADTPEVKAMIDELLALQDEREVKVDNYAALIRNLQAIADARKAEAKRIMELARIGENKVKALKERLQIAFETMGITKIETPRFTVRVSKNGGKQPLEVDEADVPPSFMEAVYKTNKQKIRDALEAGEALPFARLGERGSRIDIK